MRMDLEQLLFHRRLAASETMAREASLGSRFDLVRYYDRRITRLRRERGASPFPGWAQ